MTINLNGVEFYSAQEVDARIREAIAGKDKEVDVTNLPIGTLVKVVGNIAEHEHEVGEILPITEVDEGCLDELYRLDGRGVGWVSVDDIEFVSFPEEEESTSGDEGLTVDEDDPDHGFRNGDYARVIEEYYRFDIGEIVKIDDVEGDGVPLVSYGDKRGYIEVEYLTKVAKPAPEFVVGDTVKVLRNTTEGYDEGTICKVVEILPWRSLMIESDCGRRPFSHPESDLELVENSDDSEIKAGDTVIATEDEVGITEGVEYEIKEFGTGTLYFLDDDGDIRHVWVNEEILRKKMIEAIDEPKFEVGDILRCNKGSVYVTEGKLYEVLAIDRDGDAVYMDDGNSVSYVNETDIPERFEII